MKRQMVGSVRFGSVCNQKRFRLSIPFGLLDAATFVLKSMLITMLIRC